MQFVVDGSWTTDHTAPQEKDHEGNENNVLLPAEMDIAKLEEASLAAAINSAVPDSTTAQLAGAVPLEKSEEAKKEEGREASSAAAILSSAAPESTTAQLAGAVPLKSKKENLTPPGGFPETPAADLDKQVKVDPLPAAEGALNPIKLEAGEPVPKDISAGAIGSYVTLDEASYEQSDRIPGINTMLPPVTSNLIPESSLPIIGGNAATTAVIDTVTPTATTAALAAEVPKEEPKVPEIVKKSQLEAAVQPEASAISEEVREKAAVEEELLEKVAEAPSTSEGTAGKGTEKSEADKTAAEKVLAAATSAGEVALGAAIVAVGSAGAVAAEVATKASNIAADVAQQASGAAAEYTAKATHTATEATHAATDAASSLPEKIKGALPGAAQEAAAEKQENAINAVSPEVPAQVKESLREAGESPEAAVNTAAVENKEKLEGELLEVVKPAKAVGESSSKGVEKEEPVAVALKEQPESTDAPKAETKPLAVEPPQSPVVVEAFSEAKPAEEIKASDEAKVAVTAPTLEEIKPLKEIQLDEVKPEATPQVVEPVQPPMAVPTVSEAKPAETAPTLEEIKPSREIRLVDEAKPGEEQKAVEVTEPAPEVPAPAAGAVPETTEHAAAAETAKASDAHPATNGASAGANKTADGTASERKKKNRFSGFISKLKHKFT